MGPTEFALEPRLGSEFGGDSYAEGGECIGIVGVTEYQEHQLRVIPGKQAPHAKWKY